MHGCNFKRGPLYRLEPYKDVKLNPPWRCLWKTCICVAQKFPSFSHFMLHVGYQALFDPLLLRLPPGNVLATYWKQQWKQEYRLFERQGRLLTVFPPSKSLLYCFWENTECAFLSAQVLSKRRGPSIPQPLSGLSGELIQISSTQSINQRPGRSVKHTCPLTHPSGESLKSRLQQSITDNSHMSLGR